METHEREKICLNNYKQLIKQYIENGNLHNIDLVNILKKIENGLTETMSAANLAHHCAETAASMVTQNKDYAELAAIILVNYHNMQTLASFSEKIALISRTNNIISEKHVELVEKHAKKYDEIIDYTRDFQLSYFSMQSLLKSYLLKIDNVVVERPQDMFMRVAIQLHEDNFERVKETYNLMSQGYFTHATPTLFSSILKKAQLASCFLVSPKGDSIKEIFDTVSDCALISKHSGGIGLNLHEIRSYGSLLRSSGGVSKGILPLIKVLSSVMKYVNNGGKKRNSSIAFYLEPWHRDILQFLDIRKNTGPEDQRVRDLFTGIWMNDLFMERVEKDQEWSLFDPVDAPGLHLVWGDKFRTLYTEYEKTHNCSKIRAQELWRAILISQIETGTPYIVYKDTANRLSNQSHLGTIRSSNLCAEIIEYSDANEIAVCNLSSISLPKFVKNGVFQFHELRDVVAVITENLNRAIDTTFYPIEEARSSNMRHRPIGIGVQGLGDTFALMRYPFESAKACNLNKMIFETIYFSAIEASVRLAKRDGYHESFPGSKLSKGIFHWQLMNAKPCGLWDWDALRTEVITYGTRNSLFVAPMPTAGTSQILGNNECFEPFTSNIYTRRTIAGEFQMINKYLMDDLAKLGLWSNEMRNLIIDHDGSIQKIPGISREIKDIYKTVWEIKMKSIVDMAADRQPFVDQSQSLNIYLEQPTYKKLTSMHFHGWKRGLKTGMYYLRTKPISNAIKFTVDQNLVEKTMSSLQDYELSMSKGDTENQLNNNGCESCSC